jgi:hypothetical protein
VDGVVTAKILPFAVPPIAMRAAASEPRKFTPESLIEVAMLAGFSRVDLIALAALALDHAHEEKGRLYVRTLAFGEDEEGETDE